MRRAEDVAKDSSLKEIIMSTFARRDVMKYLMISLTVVSLCGTTWGDCPKGSIEYEGVCAQDLQPVEADKGNNPAWVSDEKPPRHAQPAWETGDEKALQLSVVKESTDTAHDYSAEGSQGKQP